MSFVATTGEKMSILKFLGLEHDKTIAIVGAGGKTALMWLLAREAAARGERVLATTSTHIFMPSPSQCDRFVPADQPLKAACALAPGKIVCAGTANASGKCTGLSPHDFAQIKNDEIRIVYEADGAKRLPVKIHSETEPVIHSGTDAAVIVLGLSALDQPACMVCHRWPRWTRFRTAPMRPLSPADLLDLAHESAAAAGLSRQRLRILLNQADLFPDDPRINQMVHSLRQDGFQAHAAALQPGGCAISSS